MAAEVCIQTKHSGELRRGSLRIIHKDGTLVKHHLRFTTQDPYSVRPGQGTKVHHTSDGPVFVLEAPKHQNTGISSMWLRS